MNNVKKIVDLVLKQSASPELTSTRNSVVILRRSDFKKDSIFNYLIESTGDFDKSEIKFEDYSEIQLHTSKVSLKKTI
jgi:hypothetical protein